MSLSSPLSSSPSPVQTAQPKSPKSQRQWRRIGISVALGLAATAFVMRLPGTSNRPVDQSSLSQSVVRQTLPITLSANGMVESVRAINLSPKSAGVIKALLVNEGDRVVAGQVIALMDDTNLRGHLIQAQAQLAQQQANL